MGVTLRHRRLEPFGVEIEHDLSAPLAPSEAYHFVELFRRHGLVLARGQSLSMARQRELCGLIGPILERGGEDGIMSNERGPHSAGGLAWHADAAYTEHPFEALSLHALDVVDGASSTRFVHVGEAWSQRPPELASAIAGREQEMISPHYEHLDERTCNAEAPLAMKRGIRLAVLDDPKGKRKLLWVSELQTARLINSDPGEGRAMLNAIFDWMYAPERVFEHRWRTGDLIVWDNCALQHARGDLSEVGRRVLQRVIVGTEGVAPHVAQ